MQTNAKIYSTALAPYRKDDGVRILPSTFSICNNPLKLIPAVRILVVILEQNKIIAILCDRPGKVCCMSQMS